MGLFSVIIPVLLHLCLPPLLLFLFPYFPASPLLSKKGNRCHTTKPDPDLSDVELKLKRSSGLFIVSLGVIY